MGTPPAQGAPRNLSSEAGVTLIETLISAVILVIIVGAVMTTIDASGRTTAVNKNRSVAATLAEQDQERLRAMSPTLLATYSAPPQTVMVGDAGHQVPYTVDSDVEWVFDATGATQSCENSGSQANYLRISSTVTSSVVGTRVRPVTMRSIVAPRVESFPENTGTLTVKVADQLGGPVANMPVTISPAASVPRSTNEFGCAVFSHIPVGAYTATLDSLGYVNEQRQQTYSSSTNVNLSQTTNLGMTYALATSIAVRVKTDIGGGPIDSFAHAVTVANAKSGDVVAISPAGALTNTITVPSLFPYPDGYTAFTGRCGLNDPADPSYQPANAAYVATAPGFTNVTPGVPASVTTHQPSVNLKVVGSGSTPLSGANMVFTPVPASCGSVSNTTKFARTSGADGFATERGLPFGKYTVCVDKVISGTTRRETMATTIDNTSPAGVTPTQMTLTTADSRGMPVTRLRSQRGFTMVEVLAVMLIGGIVMAGVASLMQVAMRQSTGIVSRTDAIQRGRLVMDRMTRELRSQVCLDLGYVSARPALESADRNSVTFFTDLSDGTKPVVKRQITYDAANKKIVEKQYVRSSAAGVTPTTFSTTPTTTTLLENVTSKNSTGDFFSFRKYTGPGSDATDTVVVSGATPLSSADLAAVARITIAMDVRPSNAKNGAVFTRLEDSVLVRNLNKNPDYSPTNPDALRCE